jgi:exopolyphosphatase/guanosine-5'-triphosphate,3'-diphosphate pyrophosphatase
VLDVFDRLAHMTAEERTRIPGVEAGRADVIVGGTAVLLALFDVLDASWLIASEGDILDGLAASIA